MKIQNTAEAEAAIEWVKKEIASDPDGNGESDMAELESAYTAIFGESFPSDEDRDEQADPRGCAMWSDIRAALADYGAWDAEELANDDANFARLIWIAACNVTEEPQPDCSEPVNA